MSNHSADNAIDVSNVPVCQCASVPNVPMCQCANVPMRRGISCSKPADTRAIPFYMHSSNNEYMKGRLYYIALACLSLLLLWEVQDLAKFHTSTPPPNSDFSAYYLGAERLLADPAMLYELDAPVHSAGYIYPPLSILLFLPFALFDYHIAYLLFVSVIAIALFMSVWCVNRRGSMFLSPGPQIIIQAQESCEVSIVCLAGALQRPRLQYIC